MGEAPSGASPKKAFINKVIGACTGAAPGLTAAVLALNNGSWRKTMARYITQRVLRSILTMFIIITVLFALLRLMPVEGYFENYDKMSSTQIQVKLQSLGLTDSLPKQLVRFYNQLLHGDLGESNV